MKDFNYDGTYPGYVDGEWIVDERDGNIWLNIPGRLFLQGFPRAMSLHFMESPKEYGVTNLSLNDEVFSVKPFMFDEVLSRHKTKGGFADYVEVIIGKVLDLTIPDYIPPGTTIGSIVIKDENGIPCNVINLRDILTMNYLRTLDFKFGVAVRMADYGLLEWNDVDLGNGYQMSCDTFFVESPIYLYNDGITKYSSPQMYQAFMNSLTNTNEWFERYCEIPSYSPTALIGPQFTLKSTEEKYTLINLAGELQAVQGFQGIKSIKIPFMPGVSAVIRFRKFKSPLGEWDYIYFNEKEEINFNVITRLIEVNR